MKILKSYAWLIITVSAILILVFVRLSGLNHFKPDAYKWAEPTFTESNILSLEQADQLPGSKLVISDCDDDRNTINLIKEAQCLTIEQLMSKQSLRKIKRHQGPIIVSFNELAVSARIWMLISQMGYRNIFIIAPGPVVK